MCLSSCRIFLIGTFSPQCNQYRIQFEQQPRRRKFKNRIGLNLLSWQLQYPLLFVFEIKYCSHDQTGRQALVNAGKSVNYDTKIEILNYINTLNILEYNLTIYVLLRLQKYNELMRSTFIRQIIKYFIASYWYRKKYIWITSHVIQVQHFRVTLQATPTRVKE